MGIDIAAGASQFYLTSPSGTTLSLDGTVANVMTVNANGILTRPQTPYMRGQIPAGSGNPYNAGGAALKISADVNFGGCWNNATGLWTCPVAGYYMATAGSIAGGVPGYGYLYFRKNNVDQHFTHWNHASSWHYISLSCVSLAAIGDYFSWHVVSQSPANGGLHGNGNHCMFSIALMA